MSAVKSELSAKALGKRKAVEEPNSVGGYGDRIVDDDSDDLLQEIAQFEVFFAILSSLVRKCAMRAIRALAKTGACRG